MGVRVQSASKEGSRGGGVEWCHATRHLGHLARAVARVERLALGTLAQRVPLVEYEGTSGLRAHVRWTCVGHVPSLLRWVHPAATRFTRTLALPTS
jgi:hypothetical protein